MKLMTPEVRTASAAESPGMMAARQAPWGPLRSHLAPVSLLPPPVFSLLLSKFFIFWSTNFHFGSSRALRPKTTFFFLSHGLDSSRALAL